ncbi:PD-(D/E)XK nuclease family protein, partial [Faecalitalea cylindroides]|uniref:PD-(D/E)XK nuclease family protein n=1 Tax=Faecalitalea cylindroides TaxID=39483 RepID=UPI003AB335E7
MSKELTNNLFNYATSELSQDAFLCWLLSYAQNKDYNGDDAKLKKCAQSLIKVFLLGQKVFFEKDLIEKDLIVKKIEKQWKYIDVLVTLESDKKIIIEDKTYTTDHDNQLERYKDKFKNEANNIFGVYYKTGFCCETIINDMYKGYYFFDLNKIKEFFEKYDDIDNAVFNNYRDFIMEYHKERNNFIGLPVSKWTPTMIQGFYDNLVKK